MQYILFFILLAGIAAIYFLRSTPYGFLDTKTAIVLKVLPEREEGVPPEKQRREILKLVKKYGKKVPILRVENHIMKVGSQEIPIRLYSNHKEDNLPILIFYHGGGWVVGDLDTHDGVCRNLAKSAKVLVISVDYRLAPEHPFPDSFDDAYAALLWISKNGQTLGGNPKKMAVGGDSAGGNLAAAVALKARNEKGPKISFQALIYPVTDLSKLTTTSYQNFSEGFFLSKQMMAEYINHYTPDSPSRLNPYASPLLADSLENLPPAIVITAGFDPLRDEGEAYGKRLQAAGVPTTIICYKGMVHGFFGTDGFGKKGLVAVKEVGAHLESAFS